MNPPPIKPNGDPPSSLSRNSEHSNPQMTFSPVGNHLQILPDTIANASSAPKTAVFVYLVKLDFTKFTGRTSTGQSVVNVPQCLRQWIQQTRLLSPTFQLLPYDEGPTGNSGQPITHEDQLPQNDASAYMQYYHNHRLIRNNSHLTGMIRFSISIPWHVLKDPKKAYYHWLRSEGIFMSKHNFQMDTVFAAGWFFGVHPDITRRDDSHAELLSRTNLPPDVKFQLSSRTINIPLTKNGTMKTPIRALVVECDSKHIAKLREAMFRLGDPKRARHSWPITGHFMFVPLFETKAWPHSKIVKVAQLHTRTIDRLTPFYLDNLKDIDTKLEDDAGNTLTVRAGLNQFEATTPDGTSLPLFHSVHKTNRDTVITLLVDRDFVPAAEQKLLSIHEILVNSLPRNTHDKVLFPDRPVQVTGRIIDSVSSTSYSSLFDDLLAQNPQEDAVPPPTKVPRIQLSYAQATSNAIPESSQDAASESPSNDIDTLLSRMKEKFGDFEPLSAADVEGKIQTQTRAIMKELDERFEKRLTHLEASIDTKFSSITSLEDRIIRSNKEFHQTVNSLIEHNYGALATFMAQVQSNMTILQQNMIQIHQNAPPDRLRPLVQYTLTGSSTSPQNGPQDGESASSNDDLEE